MEWIQIKKKKIQVLQVEDKKLGFSRIFYRFRENEGGCAPIAGAFQNLGRAGVSICGALQKRENILLYLNRSVQAKKYYFAVK